MIESVIFTVTDGELDDLARLAIAQAAKVYPESNIIIFTWQLCSVPLTDEIFNISDRITQKEIGWSELEKQVPNVMNKEFYLESKNIMTTHWMNAINTNKYLANFSDLVLFHVYGNLGMRNFLYLDTDMLCLKPYPSSDYHYMVAEDIGSNGKPYINASLCYVPKKDNGFLKRAIKRLDNELLDKYHFRYDAVGPVFFDKTFDKAGGTHVYEPHSVNRLAHTDVYEDALAAATNNRFYCLEAEVYSTDKFLNIPRSALYAAMKESPNPEKASKYGIRIMDRWEGLLVDFIGKIIDKNIEEVEVYD